MPSIDRSRRVTFEEVADIFNEVTPGYPEELYDDVVRLAGIPRGGRILDIGCGPGNGTLNLARRGYRITGIELGERLAAYARHNLRAYPQVEILTSSFEDWPLEPQAYDLAVSADAFHWIQPEIGYPKVAAALKPGGSAAFWWNVAVDPDTAWSREIRQVYQSVAPELENPDCTITPELLTQVMTENFAQSGCYGPVSTHLYHRTTTLTGPQLTRQLRTFSSHRELDDQVRARLYAEIEAVIARHGGQVEKPRRVLLVFAPLKPQAPARG